MQICFYLLIYPCSLWRTEVHAQLSLQPHPQQNKTKENHSKFPKKWSNTPFKKTSTGAKKESHKPYDKNVTINTSSILWTTLLQWVTWLKHLTSSFAPYPPKQNSAAAPLFTPPCSCTARSGETIRKGVSGNCHPHSIWQCILKMNTLTSSMAVHHAPRVATSAFLNWEWITNTAICQIALYFQSFTCA